MRRVVHLELNVPKFLPYMNEKKHNTLLLEVHFGWFFFETTLRLSAVVNKIKV